MDLLSQHEAFLRAIFDAPDDDTPRAVYADWLMEHGNAARGEFIREQLAFPGSEREEALRLAHETTWRAELPALPGVRWGDFRRGFVEAIEVDNVAAFLKNARGIFAVAPIRSVWILRADNEDDDDDEE